MKRTLYGRDEIPRSKNSIDNFDDCFLDLFMVPSCRTLRTRIGGEWYIFAIRLCLNVSSSCQRRLNKH